MPEIIKEIDLNPITVVYEVTADSLIKKEIPAKPVTISTSWNIEQEQAAIDKIDGVISLWQAKRKVHQDIINKYKGLLK